MSLRIVGVQAVNLFRSNRRIGVVLQHMRMNSAGASSDDEVILERVKDKGVITLNRPKALNALNLDMIRTIYPKLQEWTADPDTSMVIIKGAGGKAFCAGGDIRAVTEAGKVGGSLSKDFFKEEYILNNAIGSMKIPWVALIHGITMGGGVGLSVHGRYRVATEKTVFAMPETGIGLFPDVGGGYFLPRLRGNLGTFLALTGFRLKGRDVFKAGVATHFVDSSRLADLESELLSLSKPSATQIHDLMQNYHQQCTPASDTEFVLQAHLEHIDRLFGGDSVEEIVSALLQEGSDWSKQQAQTIGKMSPTSLKVTLRQLRAGIHMTLPETLEMEYRLSQRCIEDNDFYEGVRAVLVDKDHAPQWNPSALAGVTQDKLDWYFSPLPDERELKL